MKRYFLVHDDNMPTVKEMGMMGVYQWIDLVSFGEHGDQWNVLCLHDEHVNPKPTWFAFPSVLDSRTTLAEAPLLPHRFLADVGLTGEETAMDAVLIFSGINPLMTM